MHFVLPLPLRKPPLLPILQFLATENQMVKIINFLILNFPLLIDDFLHIGRFHIVTQIDIVIFLKLFEELFYAGVHNFDAVHDHEDADLVIGVPVVYEGFDVLAHACESAFEH